MGRQGKGERVGTWSWLEYLDREPALKADCVVAQSEGDLGNTRSIKGGTAGYKACPFKHSSVGRVFSRTGLFVLPEFACRGRAVVGKVEQSKTLT